MLSRLHSRVGRPSVHAPRRLARRAGPSRQSAKVHQSSKKGRQAAATREVDITKWSKDDVGNWLFDVCRAPNDVITKVLTKVQNGRDFANLEYSSLDALDLPYYFTNLIYQELTLRRIYPEVRVKSDPYGWPYNGILHPGNTALVIVDMQNDFLDKEGYIAQVNPAFNITKAREIIPQVSSALDIMRKMNFHIIHTREGHHESLLDLPANKHWRSRVGRNDPGIGDPAPYKGGVSKILTRGNIGWEIIPELKPQANEIIIDKPGKGAFVGTSLELHLTLAKIQNLVFTGVTTDVCVHTIIREANDRGYECLLLGDATCSVETEVHDAALRSIQLSNGIFGCTSSTADYVKTLKDLDKLLKKVGSRHF